MTISLPRRVWHYVGASNLTEIFMIKTSLFADQEREAKLNKLGDALQVMEQHVDCAERRLTAR